MANFRIDTLLIERNGNGTTKISGVCNSDASNPISVTGVYDSDTKETTFTCPANTANDKINFMVDNLDFYGYGDAEMMAGVFVDAAVPAGRLKKVQGTRDLTKFPPPSSRPSGGIKNTIVDDFTVQQISIQRKAPLSSQDEFTMQIDLNYSSPHTSYSNGIAELHSNPYFLIDMVYMEFSSNKDGMPHSGTFSLAVQCPTIPMVLKNYATEGLPLILKDIATIWPDVNKKVALLSVE